MIKIATDGSPTITTPLSQIYDAQTRQQLYTLPAEDIKVIGKNPLTFIITIQTSVSTINVSLFKKIGDQKTKLTQTTINSPDQQQNRALYWYHGLGFMSPGCQAIFKMIQPLYHMQEHVRT